MRNALLRLVTIVAMLASGVALTHAAEAFPSKPIRLIVGYAPGGAADIPARVLAQEMTESIGQTVFVENKAGANSLIATKELLRAPADGYTLIAASLAHTVNPIVIPASANYDPIGDFSPISLMITLPLIAITAYDSPLTSLQNLIQKARSAPGTVSYGSAGNGGAGHLAGALLGMSASVEMTHVPFKGNAPALTEVMAGRVSFTFFPTVGIPELVAHKRVKVLAVANAERMAQFPGVPTMAESGFPGFEETAPWLGVLAPAKTPPQIVKRLNEEISKAIAKPSVKRKLASLGAINIVGGSPEEFSHFLKQDFQRWKRVIKASGIKAE